MPRGSLHDAVLANSLPKLVFSHSLLIILLVVTLGASGKAPDGFGEILRLRPAVFKDCKARTHATPLTRPPSEDVTFREAGLSSLQDTLPVSLHGQATETLKQNRDHAEPEPLPLSRTVQPMYCPNNWESLEDRLPITPTVLPAEGLQRATGPGGEPCAATVTSL